MNPRQRPRRASDPVRLLVIDPRHDTFFHARPRDLGTLLREGDVVVLNDAATLPASFRVQERHLELRLMARGARSGEFRALLFGEGDFRTPTEERPAPPPIALGERLALGPKLTFEVTRIDPEAPRLIDICFSLQGAALLTELYRYGRPIQYAYVPEPLALWDVQNRFATRPWAFELPSAGQAFDGELLLALRRHGIRLASLTHAAGISSTGSELLDRRLPLPERYEIPAATANAALGSRRRGGRVLAVGTTVVRALEANWSEHGTLRAGLGEARLVIGPAYRPAVVGGLISGMHEVGSSHFELLRAFANPRLLEQALVDAERRDYRTHEFGDFCLIWPGSSAPGRGANSVRLAARSQAGNDELPVRIGA